MTKSALSVRIPQITSLDTAITLYYTTTELSSKDVIKLFGSCSTSTVTKLKGIVRQKMAEQKIPVWNAQNINTKVAYETWGLDIEDLKYRKQELEKLGM